MVQSHSAANQKLANGIRTVPDCRTAFATTQAAYRFLNNDRVTLRKLSEPLIEAGRREVQTVCDDFVLVAHDWSQLMYPEHQAKQDRIALSSKQVPEGYELQSALLISDRDGTPLAPLAMSLRAADGVHCSRSWQVREPASPLDELDPMMRFAEQSSLGRPCVHLVDAEADSVWHDRQWDQRPDRWFVVRADDRYVEFDGSESRCSALCQKLHQEGRFVNTRPVLYHGRPAQQWVAGAAMGGRTAGPFDSSRPTQPPQVGRPPPHPRSAGGFATGDLRGARQKQPAAGDLVLVGESSA